MPPTTFHRLRSPVPCLPLCRVHVCVLDQSLPFSTALFHCLFATALFHCPFSLPLFAALIHCPISLPCVTARSPCPLPLPLTRGPALQGEWDEDTGEWEEVLEADGFIMTPAEEIRIR